MRATSALAILAAAARAVVRVEAAEAVIDAAGEAALADDGACQPTRFLNGKLSSCDAFQIATLNASPRRCLHIEAPPPPKDGDDGPITCTDFPRWFDGTNGCSAYGRMPEWCEEFKDANYMPRTPYTANQACCVCGGGTKRRPRLQVGEYVKLSGVRTFDQCDSLKIVEIGTAPKFHYLLEATKDCGPKTVVQSPGGRIVRRTIEAGKRLMVPSDDEKVIRRYVRVELKRCRNGKAEQEFELVPMGYDEESGSDLVDVRHKLTGIDLASVLEAKRPFFNISQAFEDGLFDESSDFFFLKVVSNLNEGRVYADGVPYRPTYSYLASGFFGETVYSLAQTKSETAHRGVWEQEFAMWKFLPVQKEELGDDGDGSASVDEHAEWLVRMTQIIGIDYLTQLPPWHLLDTERDASKGEVKSRFRELSRYFHPDKLVQQLEKKELFERIFVILQNAYQGLKGANEKEKEQFRVAAEAGSQLFAHSQYVVELLPFHWTALDNSTDGGGGRYILNAASHLNATLFGNTSEEDENEPSVQLWVSFMYNARCGMSRTVAGMVDIAARHLEEYENIKVGAYGCGLYTDVKGTDRDQLGVTTDPICAQFKRRETPNVHLIVETVPGRRRDENGEWVEVPPDPEVVRENAQFKHFYSAVPNGNTTQFFPHHFIEFALAGKKVWQNNHLVHRMKRGDFSDPAFTGNVSIVAYLDGTGNGDTNAEVVDAITSSLPAVAKRFAREHVYVGIARCGSGDDDDSIEENDSERHRQVDCSELDVSWLPDVKIYPAHDTVGVSLLRGQFGDTRDVQIALESMGNVLRMMLGGEDDDDDEDLEEMEEEDAEAGGGGCERPPPPPDYDLDLDEIEGRMEETPLLEDASKTKQPQEKTESKPALEQEARKPKLASGDRAKLSDGRERTGRDRISGFQRRESRRAGGGSLLGGGSSGGGGFIAG